MTSFEHVQTNKKTGRTTYLVKNSNPATMNAIRRACIELVPTMAIETLEVHKNSGALYDEMLAHRLGLLPLTTDLKNYTIQAEGEEETARNSLKLTLKTKGSGYVYAEELESQDPKVKAVEAKAIITKLLKGQEIELIATAKLQTGTYHAKHSPGLAWYTYKATAKVNASHPDIEQYKNRYPPQAFKNGKLDANAIEEHQLYDACHGINKDLVDVQFDDSQFLFHLEPWGQLSPKDILTQGLNALGQELDELNKKL